MASHRDSSTIGTVVGIIIMIVAIAGSVFLDWTWSNPEEQLLPLILGVVAAVVGVLVITHNLRR